MEGFHMQSSVEFYLASLASSVVIVAVLPARVLGQWRYNDDHVIMQDFIDEPVRVRGFEELVSL